MKDEDFERALEELESAEDFLTYFGVDFDPPVVHVNRLHILQRFHDYLAGIEAMPIAADQRRSLYAKLLARAYQDFVESDARTEKVFRIFQSKTATVDLEDLTAQLPRAP